MPESLDVDTAATRKARGAFFTPVPVARHIATWAVRDASDVVVEPSCGEAALLLQAVGRLKDLGADLVQPNAQLVGYELHPESAARAQSVLSAAGAENDIWTGDFFQAAAIPDADAVIGNPPFVRFHAWNGEARATARAVARAYGVELSAMASSWAPFTVHATGFLRPGGRLGLVLPAELLTVNYAAPVRRFLMERFASIELVTFEQRIFPGIQEDVVLLLAEGSGPTDALKVRHLRSGSQLASGDLPPPHTWRPDSPQSRWSAALLPTDAAALYRDLTDVGGGFTPLRTWGETTLGIVTGANRFFALSPGDAHRLDLHDEDVLALSPPGSRHLRGLSYTRDSARVLGDNGAATLLFRPVHEPSQAARRYIRIGEDQGIPEAYKCRVRSPWWRVPIVPPGDLLLTCMNADAPRLVTNTIAAHHLNSVHGVYLRPQHLQAGRDLLPIASLSTLTLLSAEVAGRSYGGGLLKLEPGEADLWSVPTPELVEKVRDDLMSARGGVAACLARQDLQGAAAIVDQILLVDGLGLDPDAVKLLSTAREGMVSRRQARGRAVTQ